jgi:hypothetical protein
MCNVVMWCVYCVYVVRTCVCGMGGFVGLSSL